ncbi:MAG: DUF2961 domain-containing protein [Armatimonadota bacterium]|nr:DUF2961 domain-containing protein [Armatimonadota bacterium]
MWILSLCLSILLASSAIAAKWDPYVELASPEIWDSPMPGRSLMFSGSDPRGMNKDSGNFLRIEPEGAPFDKGDWVLAEMEGPGSITRIWVTGRDSKEWCAKICGRIRIYIDSKDTPAIDLPIEDFFGKAEPFATPLATATSGGWVSYMPIPFSEYCKVVVTDHKDGYAHRHTSLGALMPQLYYHVCWRKAPAGARVEPFSMSLSKTRRKLISQAAAKLEWTASAKDPKSFAIAPGESVEVFKAEGKGRIAEFSLVCPDLDGLWLTAHWDGSDKPAIDTPARMFFSEGLEPRPFKSLPLRFDGKVHACRFPMPFARGARLYLKNTSDHEIQVGVAVNTGKAPGKSQTRFHARYIDEQLAEGPPDLVVLDTKGSGHFVGMSMVVPSNFLEGNESFSVDGAKPAWVGTGTEDYFNGGWYFCHGPYDQPFSGCIHKGKFVTSYRFHLTDAVPFSKSIKVCLEHGARNDGEGRARGVAYWYAAPR